MMETGRICLKIAGRDGNNPCVIIEKVDNTYVIVDGFVRRKKVNMKHLEPTKVILKITNSITHAEIVKLLEKEGYKQKKKTGKIA